MNKLNRVSQAKLQNISPLNKIEKLIELKEYKRAAFQKGVYERRNATYLPTNQFLNDYEEYLQGLNIDASHQAS